MFFSGDCWQIYTDWANHYLEKVKSKRRIQDLPNDVTDGVILADVIEAVGELSYSLQPRLQSVCNTTKGLRHQSRQASYSKTNNNPCCAYHQQVI